MDGGQELKRIAANLSVLVLLAGCSTVARTPVERQADKPIDRTAALRGCFGTYDAQPRKADGRVDNERLLRELVDLRVNTYSWLVWRAPNDWEDLAMFLPQARAQGIKVWVALVPPSESPPKTKAYSEPFRLDYDRWGEEIARLSLREPNVVAWSIDDFNHNLKIYTPEKVRAMVEGARAINPRLAFVPCSYYRQITPEFAQQYGPIIDGVLFPYRSESTKASLTDAAQVEKEVARVRELLGPGKPVIVDVYATRHSQLGPSTPEYVREVMLAAGRCADGLHVYCHQDPVREKAKYEISREIFHRWAAKGFGPVD